MEFNLNNSLNLNHANGQTLMSTSYGFERDESTMNQSDYNDMEYDDENSLQNSSYLNFTSNIINIPKFEFHKNNLFLLQWEPAPPEESFCITRYHSFEHKMSFI